MNPLYFTGTIIVTFALVSYSIAVKSENQNRKIIPRVLVFITLGVILDVIATVFLIMGARNSPFHFQGFATISALLLMLIALVKIWQAYNKTGTRVKIAKGLHLYTHLAYLWWVFAYFLNSIVFLT